MLEQLGEPVVRGVQVPLLHFVIFTIEQPGLRRVAVLNQCDVDAAAVWIDVAGTAGTADDVAAPGRVYAGRHITVAPASGDRPLDAFAIEFVRPITGA